MRLVRGRDIRIFEMGTVSFVVERLPYGTRERDDATIHWGIVWRDAEDGVSMEFYRSIWGAGFIVRLPHTFHAALTADDLAHATPPTR